MQYLIRGNKNLYILPIKLLRSIRSEDCIFCWIFILVAFVWCFTIKISYHTKNICSVLSRNFLCFFTGDKSIGLMDTSRRDTPLQLQILWKGIQANVYVGNGIGVCMTVVILKICKPPIHYNLKYYGRQSKQLFMYGMVNVCMTLLGNIPL